LATLPSSVSLTERELIEQYYQYVDHPKLERALRTQKAYKILDDSLLGVTSIFSEGRTLWEYLCSHEDFEFLQQHSAPKTGFQLLELIRKMYTQCLLKKESINNQPQHSQLTDLKNINSDLEIIERILDNLVWFIRDSLGFLEEKGSNTEVYNHSVAKELIHNFIFNQSVHVFQDPEFEFKLAYEVLNVTPATNDQAGTLDICFRGALAGSNFHAVTSFSNNVRILLQPNLDFSYLNKTEFGYFLSTDINIKRELMTQVYSSDGCIVWNTNPQADPRSYIASEDVHSVIAMQEIEAAFPGYNTIRIWPAALEKDQIVGQSLLELETNLELNSKLFERLTANLPQLVQQIDVPKLSDIFHKLEQNTLEQNFPNVSYTVLHWMWNMRQMREKKLAELKKEGASNKKIKEWKGRFGRYNQVYQLVLETILEHLPDELNAARMGTDNRYPYINAAIEHSLDQLGNRIPINLPGVGPIEVIPTLTYYIDKNLDEKWKTAISPRSSDYFRIDPQTGMDNQLRFPTEIFLTLNGPMGDAYYCQLRQWYLEQSLNNNAGVTTLTHGPGEYITIDLEHEINRVSKTFTNPEIDLEARTKIKEILIRVQEDMGFNHPLNKIHLCAGYFRGARYSGLADEAHNQEARLAAEAGLNNLNIE
jgi:hypothetical protein